MTKINTRATEIQVKLQLILICSRVSSTRAHQQTVIQICEEKKTVQFNQQNGAENTKRGILG